MTLPPDQLAPADGGEIIECQLEDDRQRWHVLGPNLHAEGGSIDDAAAVHAELTFEEQQCAFITAAYPRN